MISALLILNNNNLLFLRIEKRIEKQNQTIGVWNKLPSLNKSTLIIIMFQNYLITFICLKESNVCILYQDVRALANSRY